MRFVNILLVLLLCASATATIPQSADPVTKVPFGLHAYALTYHASGRDMMVCSMTSALKWSGSSWSSVPAFQKINTNDSSLDAYFVYPGPGSYKLNVACQTSCGNGICENPTNGYPLGKETPGTTENVYSTVCREDCGCGPGMSYGYDGIGNVCKPTCDNASATNPTAKSNGYLTQGCTSPLLRPPQVIQGGCVLNGYLDDVGTVTNCCAPTAVPNSMVCPGPGVVPLSIPITSCTQICGASYPAEPKVCQMQAGGVTPRCEVCAPGTYIDPANPTAGCNKFVEGDGYCAFSATNPGEPYQAYAGDTDCTQYCEDGTCEDGTDGHVNYGETQANCPQECNHCQDQYATCMTGCSGDADCCGYEGEGSQCCNAEYACESYCQQEYTSPSCIGP